MRNKQQSVKCKIEIVYIAVGIFYRIEVTYGDMPALSGTTSLNYGECILQPGEFVMEVHASYADRFGAPKPVGLSFVTSHQTCGPFAKTDMSDSDVIEGEKLLYIAGNGGFIIDSLDFVFESNCE